MNREEGVAQASSLRSQRPRPPGARVTFEPSRIRTLAVDRFVLSRDGIHGPSHWERVHENGVYLARHAEADVQVVQAFAFVHDCCRESDGYDPEHGERAAAFAKSIRKSLGLGEVALQLLIDACVGHEKGRVSNDPTIGTCWDSDRLDLGRVGIMPDARLLSTARAKTSVVIDWGYRRSRGREANLDD